MIEVLVVISLLGLKSNGFGGRRPSRYTFSSFAYIKGTSLCQDASFKPSTINTGPGVRLAVDVRKKKVMEGKMDNALSRDRSVIFHACAEKSPDCFHNFQID